MNARATVHLHKVAELTDYQRKLLADWLRDQAESLQLSGRQYSARYRARYLEHAKARKPTKPST